MSLIALAQKRRTERRPRVSSAEARRTRHRQPMAGGTGRQVSSASEALPGPAAGAADPGLARPTKWRQVVRHILPNRWDPSLSPDHRRRGRNPPGIDTVVSRARLSARHSDLGPTAVRLEGLSRYRPHLGVVRRGAIFLAVLSINFIGDDCADALDRAR